MGNEAANAYKPNQTKKASEVDEILIEVDEKIKHLELEIEEVKKKSKAVIPDCEPML